jgi:hypothetical protein
MDSGHFLYDLEAEEADVTVVVRICHEEILDSNIVFIYEIS